MVPIITAFAASPDRGRGLARDMQVRWAFEEVGQAYEVRLVSFAEMKEPAHLGLQAFGQIPTYEYEELYLFESGAIVLHIAQNHTGLLPENADARARAISWMFAAVSTIEPVITQRESAIFTEKNQTWFAERMPMLEDSIRKRLSALSARLGTADWLDGSFSAGDLMIVQVLRRLSSSGLLAEYENLAAYVARAEARPAFKRAFAAQLAVYEGAVLNK
ncbi:glutathione S-transferase family protein [Undibacterium danionis]|uniref:Glutathione S-transferase family protein n=1 Tax=Undibacterium danionis TaxID=1812100 RepID=A0ABV6IE20_9BURK